MKTAEEIREIGRRSKAKRVAREQKRRAQERPKGWFVDRMIYAESQMHGVINHTGQSHRGVIYPGQGLK